MWVAAAVSFAVTGHAPNESVDPAKIEHLALAEALFLANYPGGAAPIA
jgi:hypothetical protein